MTTVTKTVRSSYPKIRVSTGIRQTTGTDVSRSANGVVSPARILDVHVTMASSSPKINPPTMPNSATSIVCRAG